MKKGLHQRLLMKPLMPEGGSMNQHNAKRHRR